MLGPEKKKMKLSSDQSSPPMIYGVLSNQDHHQFLSRRWEDLDVDCLANVFSKVGMESLLLALPFVCKSWYATTHSPLYWKLLSFPEFKPYPLFTDMHKIENKTRKFGQFYDKFIEQYRIHWTRFSITGFIKLVINRSNGKATFLKLPGFCTEEGLRYVLYACPNIRMLYLCDDIELFRHSRIISELIVKWKYLKHLTLGGNYGEILKQFPGNEGHLSKDFAELLSFKNLNNETMHQILVQIGMHCKHFRSLHIYDALVGDCENAATTYALNAVTFSYRRRYSCHTLARMQEALLF